MRTTRWTHKAAVLAAAALAVAACSDDAEDGLEGAAEDAQVVEEAAAEASTEGRCDGTELTFTNRVTGESGTVSDAFARTVVEGTLYNLYATDYGLAPDDLSGYTPEPPAGQHAVLVAINAFGAGDGSELAPLAVGEEIEWTSTGDGSTKALLVTLVSSEETYDRASSPDAGGTLTVTAVGDVICGEIAYADADKEVAGTIEAPVTE